MAKLTLSLACGNYDRVQALTDETVEMEGIKTVFQALEPEEIFWRSMKYQEFDISEMSFSSYLIAKEKGLFDYTAIPVFPSRFFRHSCLFVNKNSGIEKPEDLKGKKIGVPEYQMTAALWIRGFLHDDYGVKAQDMTWFSGGVEETGRVEKIALNFSNDMEVHPISSTQTLNEMLENGEIDAFMAARAPSNFYKENTNIVRMFPDYPTVEKNYYKRTGLFPIMHMIVIKDELLERHPWVAANVHKGFEAAKQKLYNEYHSTGSLKTTFPWHVSVLEETKSIMGEDFWPYGIENNTNTLETAIRYSYEQGLIQRPLALDELFVSSTFDKFKV